MSWKEKNDCLVKEFEFKDFKEALAFITQVGFIAEEQNHHPEIRNVYNTVTLKLTTHDAGNVVTEKDKEMARMIDDL